MNRSYHMIEYIHEDADALNRTLSDNEDAVQSLMARIRDKEIQRVIITGLGSSFTASMMAAPLFRYHASLPVHILPSNELIYYGTRLINEHTIVIVVSRSGEREWVVNTLKDVIGKGAFGVAVTGVAESLLAQNAQLALVTGEGPEITYPKTKSVISCAGLLMRIGLELADPIDEEVTTRLEALRAVPQAIQHTIDVVEPQIQALIPRIKDSSPIIVGGTGSNYGVALESATKLQETTYITAYGEDTGDVLYGPMAPISEKWLLTLLVTPEDLELCKELLKLAGKSTFNAYRLCIRAPKLDLEGLYDQVLTLPVRLDPLLAGLIYLPPMQLMTYYWTIARNMNPDAPSVMRDMLDAFLPEGREEPELRNTLDQTAP